MGSGGRAQDAQGFRHLIESDEHNYTLFMTLAGKTFAWGPGGGDPRSSEVLSIKIPSNKHPAIRLRALGGVQGQSHWKSRGFKHLITVR